MPGWPFECLVYSLLTLAWAYWRNLIYTGPCHWGKGGNQARQHQDKIIIIPGNFLFHFYVKQAIQPAGL